MKAKRIIDAAYLALDRMCDERFHTGRKLERRCFEQAHKFAMEAEIAERHDSREGRDIEGFRELPETGARYRVVHHYLNAVQVNSVSAAAALPLVELYASALYDLLRYEPEEVQAMRAIRYDEHIMPPRTVVRVELPSSKSRRRG